MVLLNCGFGWLPRGTNLFKIRAHDHHQTPPPSFHPLFLLIPFLQIDYQPPAPPPTFSATSTSSPPLPLSLTSSASSPLAPPLPPHLPYLCHQPLTPPLTSSATSTSSSLLQLSPTSSASSASSPSAPPLPPHLQCLQHLLTAPPPPPAPPHRASSATNLQQKKKKNSNYSSHNPLFLILLLLLHSLDPIPLSKFTKPKSNSSPPSTTPALSPDNLFPSISHFSSSSSINPLIKPHLLSIPLQQFCRQITLHLKYQFRRQTALLLLLLLHLHNFCNHPSSSSFPYLHPFRKYGPPSSHLHFFQPYGKHGSHLGMCPKGGSFPTCT